MVQQERNRRQRSQFDLRGRQSFIDILGTVLRYVLIIVLIMVIVRYASEAYHLGYEVFSSEAMAETGQGKTVTVKITPDMSNQEIGQLLQEDGLIRDARVFPLQLRFASKHTVTPGTYELSTEMTTDEIIEKLTAEDAGTSGSAGSAATES